MVYNGKSYLKIFKIDDLGIPPISGNLDIDLEIAIAVGKLVFKTMEWLGWINLFVLKMG